MYYYYYYYFVVVVIIIIIIAIIIIWSVIIFSVPRHVRFRITKNLKTLKSYAQEQKLKTNQYWRSYYIDDISNIAPV